jgi:hypothetical protein
MATLANSLVLVVAAGLALILVGGASAACYASQFDKAPQHTSNLTGQGWVDKLLNRHDSQFYNKLGMHKHVFQRLINVLGKLAGFGNTKHVSSEEQLLIFLHYACRACPIGGCRNSFREALTQSASEYTVCALILFTSH